MLFLNHWYEGVPPFVGVAVKVTAVPEQMLFWLTLAETLTGRTEFMIRVREFEVAGLPFTQLNPDVITTLTTSPLAGI
jgi:hypothetical protein